MEKKDGFASIALETRIQDKAELEEFSPIALDKDLVFEASSYIVEPIVDKTYQEQQEQFRKELEELKERYRPFLKEYAPEQEIKRQQWDLNNFQFRYQQIEDEKDFNRALSGMGEWEEVSLPDYRGPVGKWTGFYRKEFVFEQPCISGKRYFIHFAGVDYIAQVYLNGRFVGSHEGFFAPFEMDVTSYIKYQDINVLLVVVINDAPTVGLGVFAEGEDYDGDKIYAATGLGWDDPQIGWHHCPPGAGIYNHITLEERPELFIQSMFVRPNIDESSIEAWIEVYNTTLSNLPFELDTAIYSRNFESPVVLEVACPTQPAGPGINYYRYTLKMPSFRLWSCDEPWLYVLRASLSQNGKKIDEQGCSFGMRKFHMDETNQPKGSLYLNNKPVILRGANDMGHMQQCVVRGDFEQLIEDILIAKLTNMNYYRFTQRPVQQEIYDYCDRLGMMNQTDLPLFGYLRRNQFVEGIRQAEEMERLIRSHPSAIMVTYINEPFSAAREKKGYRHLYRNELEDFFEAATRAVHLQNPDRVVKNAEGDYDPPTRTGLSDFHCYNMWYTNHALPIGKLYKGYLPAIKKGWKTGCGEYGTEGLDPLEVMMEDYPKEWVPENLDERWNPDKIVRAQTYSMHGDWFEEQSTIQDWIWESQMHQAMATRIMTDAFRRRSDVVISTAIHLLIDAWPSGWMKALVDHRRKPKPAYFAFQRSLEPIRINLRTDRWSLYSGEQARVEAWILNDTPKKLENYRVVATVRTDNLVYRSYEIKKDAGEVSPTFAGYIEFQVPSVQNRQNIYIDAELLNDEGIVVNEERLVIEVFESLDNNQLAKISYVGSQAVELMEKLGLEGKPFMPEDKSVDVILILDGKEYQKYREEILKRCSQGTRLVFLLEDPEVKELSFGSVELKVKAMNGLFFVARDERDYLTRDFYAKDFSWWYNEEKGYIDFVADNYLEGEGIHPIVYTYQKPGFFDFARGSKKKLPVVGHISYGKGEIYCSTFCCFGRVGFNPILDILLKRMLDKNLYRDKSGRNDN